MLASFGVELKISVAAADVDVYVDRNGPGGKDATADGGAAIDLRGVPRTLPWSIGAYEKD